MESKVGIVHLSLEKGTFLVGEALTGFLEIENVEDGTSLKGLTLTVIGEEINLGNNKVMQHPFYCKSEELPISDGTSSNFIFDHFGGPTESRTVSVILEGLLDRVQ